MYFLEIVGNMYVIWELHVVFLLGVKLEIMLGTIKLLIFLTVNLNDTSMPGLQIAAVMQPGYLNQ